MSAPLYWTLTALLVVVLLLIGLWAYQTATRLNRLHVRYDLSWQALDGALARRAVVARAVAADAYRHRPQGRRLAALADAAVQLDDVHVWQVGPGQYAAIVAGVCMVGYIIAALTKIWWLTLGISLLILLAILMGMKIVLSKRQAA